jgi:integrase
MEAGEIAADSTGADPLQVIASFGEPAAASPPIPRGRCFAPSAAHRPEPPRLCPRANAHAMIRRRAGAAGIKTQVGNHTFRATGITAYLRTAGRSKTPAAMANHASTRTTQLYYTIADEVSLDEVERIAI